MLTSIVLAICMILAVHGAAPVKPFSRNFEIKLTGNTPGAYKNAQGDGWQAFALPPNAGAHFAGPITVKSTSKKGDQVDLKVCMKQGMYPSLDSAANWMNECQGYVELHNATSATLDFVNELVGSGRADGGSGYVPAASAKRAVTTVAAPAPHASFQEKLMARAGATYFLAVATSKIVAKDRNITVSLTVSGDTCDGADAGKFGLDNKQCTISATPLSNNKTMKAESVGVGATKYYQFSQAALGLLANNTSYFEVTVEQDGKRQSGDLDLWARWGGLPTGDASDAHARAKDTKAPVKVRVSSPQIGADWFVAVAAPNATAGVRYNITLTVMQCEHADQAGDPCAAPERLAKEAGAASTVTVSATKMTLIELPQGIEAAVGAAALQSSDPAPQLFLRWGQAPSATEFDFKDCTLASCDMSRVILAMAPNTTENRRSGQWYAGVMAGKAQAADALVDADDDGSYEVVVWNAAANKCASDCSGHGECTDYQCTCDGSYGTANCAVSVGLQTWEWALIIGGGVLVAIGLIGCIVYFIQKQSRRAGFERV